MERKSSYDEKVFPQNESCFFFNHMGSCVIKFLRSPGYEDQGWWLKWLRIELPIERSRFWAFRDFCSTSYFSFFPFYSYIHPVIVFKKIPWRSFWDGEVETWNLSIKSGCQAMLPGVRQAQITFRMRRRRMFVCVTIVWQAHFAFLQQLKKVQNCWWRDPRQLPFQKTAQTFPQRLSDEIEDKIFKFQATVKKTLIKTFSRRESKTRTRKWWSTKWKKSSEAQRLRNNRAMMSLGSEAQTHSQVYH